MRAVKAVRDVKTLGQSLQGVYLLQTLDPVRLALPLRPYDIPEELEPLADETPACPVKLT